MLIARRPKNTHLEGLWEFPGGKLEPGEGLEACMERELLEELGIVARAETEVMTIDHAYPQKRITLHVFACTWVSGQPLGLQGQEIAWVPLADLPGYAFPPADETLVAFLLQTPERDQT